MNTSEEKIELKADRINHEQFMNFIDSQLLSANLNETTRMKILTASDEIISNIINYAYPNHDGNLSISFTTILGIITIVFTDCGKAFNPLEKKDVDTTLPLENREVGGLGIFMVKQLMDDVKYKYEDNKNSLTIVKRTA